MTDAALQAGAVPGGAIRLEAHYGDRVVPCFADRPRSLHAMLASARDRLPDAEALIDGTRRLTYAALDDRVARAAGLYAARGVGPGDRVALLLGNRAEFAIALLAVARLGAIAVPIGVREPAPGVADLLARSGAHLVVHEAALASLLPARLDTLAHRLPVEDGLDARPHPDAAPVEEEAVAVLMFTSGTSGRPKGAMLTGLGLAHTALHYQRAMALTAADRSIAAVPLTHVTGLAAQLVAMLHVGGALVLMPAFQAAAFLALAAAERMTHTVMVPAMYHLCLLRPDLAAHDLSAWRVGAFGGAPMPPATIARLAEVLPGLGLHNAYGATETSSPVTINPPDRIAARPDSVGRALPCASVAVMDEAGRAVPPGEEGEIWIAGPMVIPGYWQDGAATRAALAGGWWRSGDVGSLDADGHLRLLDRRRDVVNRGGYKVHSIEVEDALAAHPAVREAAIVPRPCPVLGQRVHAFVTLDPAGAGAREGGAVTEATLRAHCASRLADYKVPESWTLDDAPLPRNANGKLQKSVLRARLGE